PLVCARALRLVPPDVRGRDVRRDDPAGRVERPDESVRRAFARDPRPPVRNAHPRDPGRGGPMHAGRAGVGARQRDRRQRHRGRARRLPTRGPRPDGTRARARRDPADAGLVRSPSALGRLNDLERTGGRAVRPRVCNDTSPSYHRTPKQHPPRARFGVLPWQPSRGEGTMSTRIETAHVGTYPIPERRQVARVGVSVLVAIVVVIAVVGSLSLSGATSSTIACMPRVGCGEVQENGLGPDAIETSFWAAGAGAASTTWFWWALEAGAPG